MYTIRRSRPGLLALAWQCHARVCSQTGGADSASGGASLVRNAPGSAATRLDLRKTILSSRLSRRSTEKPWSQLEKIWHNQILLGAKDRDFRMTANHGDTGAYHPLQEREIRVLCLEAGAFGAPLWGTFRHVTLPRLDPGDSGDPEMLRRYIVHSWISQTNNAFDAISYAWGAPVFPHHLMMAGTHRIQLTESLHGALQHFRSPVKI
jgi:hypothetical protein